MALGPRTFSERLARFHSANISRELASLSAVATFTYLKFSVEGAAVLLDGTYKMPGGGLNFPGNYRQELR